MGKGKKRALFTGNKPIGGPAMKSRRVARKVTSQYHILITEKTQISQDRALSKQEKQLKLSEIDQKLEKIGGINKYQEASIISTQHFSTSKWILQAIRRHRPPVPEIKLRTFEVGAINTQLQLSPLLAVRSIDLHSQHPLIEEQDFFRVAPQQAYDVVVCSMVINCVTESHKRGEMIAR
ncbi:hypothetical protein EON65_52055 [archaeon]|nr:MAG: hypothetical protein EON65_52055 [archaeon]